MNNNNKQCPICRSPLTGASCKKCGYQQKKLKIVETQNQFVRFNYMRKIQNNQHITKSNTQITSQQKLKIYLKQYVRLLKVATQRISLEKGLQGKYEKLFGQQVFQIWKEYALKRRQMNLSFNGIFEKYVLNKINPEKKDQPQVVEIQQSQQQRELKLKQQQKQLQQNQIKKSNKRRRKKQQIELKSEDQTKQQLNPKTKFRSYYIITVKPLINESIQQRAIDSKSLTTCQKSYLSYLIQIKNVDQQMIRIVSNKYLKLLLKLKKRNVQKSFVKQKHIQKELIIRNQALRTRKQDSITLILLIDMIICLNAEQIHIQQSDTVLELENIYEKMAENCQFIDKIRAQLNSQKEEESPNIPCLNYQLIYTILYVASVKIGLCWTLPQILTCCGRLQIQRINIDDDIFLPAVSNQQAITISRVRKNSNLLVAFLNIEVPKVIYKWTNKWCQKLDLQPYTKIIQQINTIIYSELLKDEANRANIQEIIRSKGLKCRRYLNLDQDITSLVGVLIFVKLSVGLSNYPYIVNLNPNELMNSFQIKQVEQIKILKEFINNKQVKVRNRQQNRLIVMPPIYKNQLDIISFSRILSNVNTQDKQFGCIALNKKMIKLRNLNNLNGINCNEFLQYFNQQKQRKDLIRKQNQDVILLKYDEHLHKQFYTKELQKIKKLKQNKEKNINQKPMQSLNMNTLRQYSCLIKDQEQITYQKEPPKLEIATVDNPSSNYELMYQYNQQNLILSHRQQQLYIMEQLCLNLCDFNEFAYYTYRYESILKQFQP